MANGEFSAVFVAGFRDLFDGRRDVHGEGAGRCVREDIDDKVIRDHLEGKRRIGVYPLAGSELDRVKFSAIDIDADNREVALTILNRLEHYGLHPWIEKTKSKGWHVWLFFSTWVEAWKIRAINQLVLDDCADLIAECNVPPIEIFPKQDNARFGAKLGNYINLPYFGKDVPDRRTVFYLDGKPIEGWTPHQVKRSKESELDEIIETNGIKTRPARAYEQGEDDKPERIYHDEFLPCALLMFRRGAGEGTRNEWAFRLGIHFKRCGYTFEQTLRLMEEWDKRCTPPLGKELQQPVRSAFDPKRANESLGCENPLILPVCAKEECPVYRLNHPEITTDPEQEDQQAQSDPSKIRLTYFEPKTSEFRFVRGPLRYIVTNLNNSRGGDLRGLVIIERNGETIYRGTINLNSNNTRRAIENQLVNEYGAEAGIAADLMNVAGGCMRRLSDHHRKNLEKDAKDKQGYVLTEKEEEEAKKWALEHPFLLSDMISFTSRAGLIRELSNRCLLYLIFTSRKMLNPISGIAKGDSASGKSFLAAAILKLMPPEDVEEFTRITSRALEYGGEFSLQHKIFFVREAPGSDDSQHSLRTFLTEKDLIILAVEKNKAGKNETVRKMVRGPLSYFTTTTQLEVHAENETRYLTIFADESREMTQACMLPLAYQAEHGPLIVPEAELKVWRNFQRTLKTGQPVLIPFAQRLLEGFPYNSLRARRDFGRMLELINACAFAHQYHRDWNVGYDSDGNPIKILVASVADYAIVKQLVEGSMMRTALNIKPGQEEFLHALYDIIETAQEKRRVGQEQQENITFETGDENVPTAWVHSPLLRVRLGKTQQNIYALTKALEAEGFIKTAANRRPIRMTVGDVYFGEQGFRLPTIDPATLFNEYPEDRRHYYDPLTAPDFHKVYKLPKPTIRKERTQ